MDYHFSNGNTLNVSCYRYPRVEQKPMWCFFAPAHLEYVFERQLKWDQHEGTKKKVGHVGNPMTWPIHKVSCLIRMHKSSGIMGLWVLMDLWVYSLFHAFHTTHDPNFLLTYLEIHRLLDHSRAFCRSLLSLLSGSSGSWYTRPAAKDSKTACQDVPKTGGDEIYHLVI